MTKMSILIEDQETLTVSMETVQAPCQLCWYLRRSTSGDGISVCGHEDRPISGQVIAVCQKAGWRRGG